MSWLSNIPEARVKHNPNLKEAQAHEVMDLLAFIQRSESAAQIDHLMEEVMQWYFKREREDFPTPGQTVRLPYTLPSSLDQKIQEKVKAKQDEGDDSAQAIHVIEHALALFLSSHGALLKAWREDVKTRQIIDTNPSKEKTSSTPIPAGVEERIHTLRKASNKLAEKSVPMRQKERGETLSHSTSPSHSDAMTSPHHTSGE